MQRQREVLRRIQCNHRLQQKRERANQIASFRRMVNGTL